MPYVAIVAPENFMVISFIISLCQGKTDEADNCIIVPVVGGWFRLACSKELALSVER